MPTRTDVECNECGHQWVSGFKIENIEAGKAVCKEEDCESTDIRIIGPAKPIVPESNESAEAKQKRFDDLRKNKVDDKNEEHQVEAEAEEDALADVPLNEAEISFCTSIAARMNNGRRSDQPAAADILRYSKLKKRLDVK